LAASFVSSMPVATKRPWRTKCDAMPGLQPKEKTHVGPEPFVYTASFEMLFIWAGSAAGGRRE